MVNRKTSITFSPRELNALLEDPLSCVFLKKGKRHLALHPSTLGDTKKAIKENLNSTEKQFDAELGGILLGVTNVKVLRNEGTIVSDPCHVHLDIKARFYIFKPQVGCQLTGVVKKLSTDNIGCLVHNVFNVAIPREEQGSTQDEIYDIELGNQVIFTVEYLDFSGTLPYIRGKLIPVRGVPHGKKNKHKEVTIQNKKRKIVMEEEEEEEDTENDDKRGLFHELESSRAASFSVKQTSKPTKFNGVSDEIQGHSDPTAKIGETYSKREKELLLNEQLENLSSKKNKKAKKRENGMLGTVPRDFKEISKVEQHIKKAAEYEPCMNLKEIHGKEYESKQLPAVEIKSTRKDKNTAKSFVEDKRATVSQVKVPLVKKVIKKEMTELPKEQNLPVSYEHTKKKKRIGFDDNSQEIETMAEEPLEKKKRKHSINARVEGEARKKNYKDVISESDVSYHCEASGKDSTKMHNRMNITPLTSTPKWSPLQSKPKEKISLPYSDLDGLIGQDISLPVQQQTGHNFSEQLISKKSKQKQDYSDSLSESHSGLQIDKKAISKKVKIKEKKSGTKSTQRTALPSKPSVQKHFDGPIERNDEFSFLNHAIGSKSKRKDLSKHSAVKLSESDTVTAPQQEAKEHTSEHEVSGVKNRDELVGKTSERRKKKDVVHLKNQELIYYKDTGFSNRGSAKKQDLGLVSSKNFGFGTPPIVSKSPQTQLSASPKYEGKCLKDASSPKKKTSDQVTSGATSAHTVDSENNSDSSSSKVTKVAKQISPFRANVTQMETNQFSPIFSKTQSQSEDSDDSDTGSTSPDVAKNVTNKQCGVPVHKKANPVKKKYLPVSAKPIIGGSESHHSLPKGSKYKDKLSSEIQKQSAYINTSDSDDFYLPLTQKSPDKGRIVNTYALASTLQGDMSSGAKNNTNCPTMKQSPRKQKEMRAISAPKSEETNNHASVFKKSNSKQRSPKQQLSIQKNASNLSSTATRKNEMNEHPAQNSDSALMQSDGASSNNPLQKSVSPNKRSPVRRTTRELPKATKINKSSVSVKSVPESESSEKTVKLNIDSRSLSFDELVKARQLSGNFPSSLLRLLSKQQKLDSSVQSVTSTTKKRHSHKT